MCVNIKNSRRKRKNWFDSKWWLDWLMAILQE
jgi:hypothetical protein